MKNLSPATFLRWFSTVIVLLIVFALSLDGINRYPIRRDELTTLGHIGALEDKPQAVPISYTVESLSIYSPEHAPTFYVLANIWGQSLEFNYFALRMLSVWFGLMAVAGLYWIGRRMISHRAGVFAAIILGTNVVFYGNVHEMRSWTMLLMFTVFVWMAYWHIAHKKRPARLLEYAALFFSVLIGIYINYTIVFVLLAIGLYHLLVLSKDKRWWQITATVILAGVLYIPWIPVFLDGISNTQDRLVRDIPGLLDNLELIPVIVTHWGNGLAILFVGLVGLGLYASWKDWKTGRNLVFFFVMILGAMLIANGVLVYVRRVRYILLWLIPFSLLVAYGLDSLAHRKMLRYIPLLLIGIWVIGGYQFTNTDEFNNHLAKQRAVLYPEYPSFLPVLREQIQKRDLLVIVQYEFSAINRSKQGLESINNYYLNSLKLKITNFPQYFQWSDSGIDAEPVEYAIGLVPQYEEFWLSYHHTLLTDDITRFKELVEENYLICDTHEYGARSILIHYVAQESNLARDCTPINT